MMLVAAFAAALLATSPQTPPQSARDPAPIPAGTVEDPIVLEEVTVTGRSLDTLIRDFVDEVAEPNRNRGLARWRGTVCVGVVNLKADAAQYLADRISTVAEDMGLRPGPPGCRPNLLIMATDEPSGLARNLVVQHYDNFRLGASGTDRGISALRDFQETERPVRWWQQTMLIDSQTGQRALRIPGDCQGNCSSVLDSAPVINVFAASRVTTQFVNDIFRTMVIIDVNRIGGLTAQQLADYIAMVGLAQIDPDADTSRYSSILNVMQDPQAADGLTSWDITYLQGLYAAERNRVNVSADRDAILRSIRAEHGRLRAEQGAGPSAD